MFEDIYVSALTGHYPAYICLKTTLKCTSDVHNFYMSYFFKNKKCFKDWNYPFAVFLVLMSSGISYPSLIISASDFGQRLCTKPLQNVAGKQELKKNAWFS